MMAGSVDESRRVFLRRALAASAAGVSIPVAVLARSARAAEEGDGPYGPPVAGDPPDVLVPEGFRVEVVAVSGDVVAGTGYRWRPAPDGAATFADGTGGWYHAVNHETSPGDGGGVSVLRFDESARVVDAYSILDGTDRNCAGGPTPWGTWLSCEETDMGRVWECRPDRPSQGVVRPALGVFKHEAVAVDPVRKQLYLTEDRSDGLLYRFTPDAYPDLGSGSLSAAVVAGGVVDWIPVPDPAAIDDDTRDQLTGRATTFDGGEGIWYHNGRVYFTTKGDHRVWDLDVVGGAIAPIWTGNPDDPAVDQLTGVDNLTVENGSGDVYVAEDGGNMEIVLITPDGTVAPFLRVLGQDASELTGPVFSPDGAHLLFSSQRGIDGRGITYRVTGPFRGTPSVPSDEVTEATPVASSDDAVDDAGEAAPVPSPAASPIPAEVERGDRALPPSRTVSLEPTTPDPASTFVAAGDRVDGRTVFGAAALTAALVGAGIELRRRRAKAEGADGPAD